MKFSTIFSVLISLITGFAGYSQTITSFTPASARIGTLVTVTGTSLTSATAVSVNNVTGAIMEKTATTLKFMVMPGSSTGTIKITGATTVTSSSSLSVNTTVNNNWVQSGNKLVGSGGISGTTFGTNFGPNQGRSVALSADGSTLVVGGPGDAGNTGATWVFRRNGVSWIQEGKLLVTGATTSDLNQGKLVAVSADGNTLAIGTKDNGTWIFTRNGSAWSQQGSRIPNPDNTTGYLALSGDGNTLVFSSVIHLWVYIRNGSIWTQSGAALLPTLPVTALAISSDGTTLVIGSTIDNSETGASQVYIRSGNTFVPQGAKLVASGSTANMKQGASLALSADGNTLAIGAPGAAAIIIFTRTGTTWTQQGNRLVAVTANGSILGLAEALSADGNVLIAGSPNEVTGVGGYGAVWVFTRSGNTWTTNPRRLLGTGATFTSPLELIPDLGTSVAVSADGTIMCAGGPTDNNAVIGATWTYTGSSLTTALPTINIEEINVFPNPFTDRIQIKGAGAKGNFEIIDVSGRLLQTATYQRNQSINLSHLLPGIYWIRLEKGKAYPVIKK